MRKLLLLFLTVSTAAALWLQGAAAQESEITTKIDHRFGETIQFQADVVSEIPVAAAILYFQTEGDAHMHMGLAQVKDLGQQRYQAAYEHSVSDIYIPPFSKLNAHWEIVFADAETIRSPVTQYQYTDNRYKWTSLVEGNIRIHWYLRDAQISEEIKRIITQSETAIQTFLPSSELDDLEIYIYLDDKDFPSAEISQSTSQVDGHTDPPTGIAMVVLPEDPESRILAEQRIPNELMHIVLFRYSKDSYSSLPKWLIEGLASSVEQYANPAYLSILKKASDEGELLSMHSICSAFPRELGKSSVEFRTSTIFYRLSSGCTWTRRYSGINRYLFTRSGL